MHREALKQESIPQRVSSLEKAAQLEHRGKKSGISVTCLSNKDLNWWK